jgi:DNA-binding CsgD family transcriptional regulator
VKTIVNAGLNVVDFPPVPQDGQDGAPLHVHRLQCELATLGQRNALLETLIDALRLGVVLADREGRLQYRNRAAQEILARRDGLCDRDDILLARSPAAARALAQALTAIANGACDSEALSVPRDDGEPYALLLTQQHGPLPNNRDHDNVDVIAEPWSFLANVIQSQRAAPLVLVLIRDSRPDAVGNFAAIGRHFALTASEITLLEALTCGERLNDFCRRRGISPNTGKFHLRSLFAKTGTHRQADLVRRTVSLLASFAPFGG